MNFYLINERQNKAERKQNKKGRGSKERKLSGDDEECPSAKWELFYDSLDSLTACFICSDHIPPSLLCLSGSLSSRASSIRGFSILSVELPGLWSCLLEGPGQKMMMTPASLLSSLAKPDSTEPTGPGSKLICGVKSAACSVSSLYCRARDLQTVRCSV